MWAVFRLGSLALSLLFSGTFGRTHSSPCVLYPSMLAVLCSSQSFSGLPRVVERWRTLRLGACSVSQHTDKSLFAQGMQDLLLLFFSKYLPVAAVNLTGTVQILL